MAESGSRDGRGRFPKGVSGNPRGAPTGRRSSARAIDRLARASAVAVFQAVCDRALAGDAECARLVLSRADVAAEGAR